MKKINKIIPLLIIVLAVSLGFNIYTVVSNRMEQKQREENTLNTANRLMAYGILVELEDIDSLDLENKRFVLLNGILGGDSTLAEVDENGLIQKAYWLQDTYETMDYDIVDHALVFISQKQVLYLSDSEKRYDETEAEIKDDLYTCSLTYDKDLLVIASTVYPEKDERLNYTNNGRGNRVSINLNGAQNMVPVAAVITE